HLLAVGPEIRARGRVVEDEVGHPADRRRGGENLGRPARDRAPARIAAVAGAGDPDAAGPRDALADQVLDPAADVVLLEAAPERGLNLLAEGEAEAGRAAVVGVEHIEARADEELQLGADPRLGMRGRAAMDVDDQPLRRRRGAVEPA